MLNCFCKETKNTVTISVTTPMDYPAWLKKQKPFVRNWLADSNYKADASQYFVIPDEKGKMSQVIVSVRDKKYFWDVGGLSSLLPQADYEFEDDDINYCIAWGLGAYQFTRYKKSDRSQPRLVLRKNYLDEVETIVSSIYMVRDCINTPADDMGPSELSQVAKKLAAEFGGKFKQIVGDDLLKAGFNSIYTVGRACDDAPRLLDLRWGSAKNPRVTLVGKGVCFDTGGLDLKPSPYMLLMKKDMAGSAHVLGLARMIMQAKLPINLRVLIPAVENNIGGNAYRPGDIIKSKKGITVEIGNTDAEGRVVLSDALTEAVDEKPELLIDISTLTGAARVALGTDVPALFSNNDDLAREVLDYGKKYNDPMWQLPLYAPYRESLNSPIADINNCSSESYGGAITAALFLKEFVPDTIPWMHFDMMAWNLKPRPGKPAGGEAQALRALFYYLKDRFG